MRKHLVVFLFSFAISHLIYAQQHELVIKGSGKDLHIDHTVSPKEGIFSIGRLYNVHPKAIAAYNKLDMAKGLSLGQIIHIPLSDTNFSQKANKGKPIYYNVGAKESLEKISNAHNKVSLKQLRDWNKLANDNLASVKKLIIGFLVTNEAVTPTAIQTEKRQEPGKDTAIQVATTKKNGEQDKPAVKIEQPKIENEKKETVNSKTQAINGDTVSRRSTEKPNTELKQAVVKEEPKKEDLTKIEKVVTRPPSTTNGNIQGYFKNSFEQQVKTNPASKTETVTAGVFKMSNGLQEAKYYLLMDGVPSGTIVKVINPDNNKTIYAKVLGEMSGIRQNQGLNIRISNAAASTLDISETDKFIVKINY